MFESWVSQRKNANLREALLLRKAEKYKDAWAKLQAACDENDGEAFYFKAYALWQGGWGQRQSSEFRTCLKKAENLGCWWPRFTNSRNQHDYKLVVADEGNILACEFGEYKGESYPKDYLYAASSGDAVAQYNYATCKTGWYVKAAEQKHVGAIGHMLTCFRCSDLLTRALYMISEQCTNKIQERVSGRLVHDLPDEGLRLQELYLFGREFASGNLCGISPKRTGFASQVYYQSWYAAQKAVLLWLFWTKEENLLCPDIRRLIGKMVWATRTRPAEWGGRIDPYTKRQKK